MNATPTHRTPPHRSARRGLVLAAIVAFGFASASAAGSEGLSGAWRYAGDEAEEKARIAAIDEVTDGLNVFIKGTARSKLKERTAPPEVLDLRIEGTQLTLKGPKGKPLSIELGAPPHELEGPNGKAKISAKKTPEGLVVVMAGEKGRRVTTYALEGERLAARVRMTADRLEGPLDYRMSFRRK